MSTRRESVSNRSGKACTIIAGTTECARFVTNIALVVFGIMITYNVLSGNLRRECGKGQIIHECACDNSVVEGSKTFCRDLEKEKECQKDNTVYSYSERECLTCPPTQIFSRILGSCEDCSDGLVPYFNQCVTPVERCNNQSMKYDGTACVACASGSQLTGNECVANSKPGNKKTSSVPMIVALVIAIAVMLAVVIVVVVVQRRKNQAQLIGFRDTEPSALGGDGQIENTLALNYKFEA